MGKIQAIEAVNDEIIQCFERIEARQMNPSRSDLYFLTDKYNECNTNSYTHRQIDVCGDCRTYIFKFWNNVIIEWRKANISK